MKKTMIIWKMRTLNLAYRVKEHALLSLIHISEPTRPY